MPSAPPAVGDPLPPQRDSHPGPTHLLAAIRIGTAGVWIVFGLCFKVLHLLPRHELIVGSVIGTGWAGPATILIGAAETAMGLWILSSRWPLACITVQSIAIAGMNTVEICLARQYLLMPMGMVCANAVLLALGWHLALRSAHHRTVP